MYCAIAVPTVPDAWARSAAVQPERGGGGAGRGSANASAAPPNNIAPATAPLPINPATARRVEKPDRIMR